MSKTAARFLGVMLGKKLPFGQEVLQLAQKEVALILVLISTTVNAVNFRPRMERRVVAGLARTYSDSIKYNIK